MKPLILALCTLAITAFAQQKLVPTKDAPGTKDYPGMPRYEDSTIVLQSEQKYGELGLQIGGLSAPNSNDPKEVRKVEGRTHRSTYLLLNLGAGKRSTLEIARNYEMAFKEAGFTSIWSGGDREIRNGPPRQYYGVPELDHQLMTTGLKERRYFCMEKGGRSPLSSSPRVRGIIPCCPARRRIPGSSMSPSRRSRS